MSQTTTATLSERTTRLSRMRLVTGAVIGTKLRILGRPAAWGPRPVAAAHRGSLPLLRRWLGFGAHHYVVHQAVPDSPDHELLFFPDA